MYGSTDEYPRCVRTDGNPPLDNLRGNRNRISLRTTLLDEDGSGRTVTLDMTFRCWAPATVTPGEASCPATLSGTVTIDGTVITLHPSTDAYMSSAK